MANPFTLTFGKKPNSYISRPKDTEAIIDSFNQEPASEQVFVITGIRGSGKTVMLSTIIKHFIDEDDWIVVDLNSEKDLMEGLASELYQNGKVKSLFVKKEFSFSFKGISFSIEGETPVLTSETLVKMMLDRIKKKNKKVLITIDEVTSNEYMRVFAKSFQALIRFEYPVFLLMTGLYENISKLQDDKSLTFLYRAPKIYLSALNISAITQSYSEIFNVPEDVALALANLTKGYAYAYQVLGYLLYKSDEYKISNKLIIEYDQYLQEFVYDKLWSEFSPIEQKIVSSMEKEEERVKDVIVKNDMTNEYFSIYRDRLIKKGIIYSPSYGVIRLTLPRFLEFIKMKKVY